MFGCDAVLKCRIGDDTVHGDHISPAQQVSASRAAGSGHPSAVIRTAFGGIAQNWPNWSRTWRTGCWPNITPAMASDEGCDCMANRLAAPGTSRKLPKIRVGGQTCYYGNGADSLSGFRLPKAFQPPAARGHFATSIYLSRSR
jgi:hypothetical protein